MNKNVLKIIFLICAFITVLPYCYSQKSKQITVEDIWQNYTFYPEAPDDITPMNDGKYYAIIEDKIFINKYEYKTGEKVETIISSNELIDISTSKSIGSIDDFTFSNDESKVLLAIESKSIYRRSKEAWFWIYDLKTKKLTSLFSKGKQRLAEFSPDGNSVAFVFENNIYIKNLTTDKLTQVTTDGKDRFIINGTTDWVYEEELDITKGFNWSPDGESIAYMRFDESKVKEYSITKWGKLYPEEHKYKYPKAGEANSIVDIYVYKVKDGVSKKLDVGSENDQYIPRMQWVPNSNNLMVMRMNRLQNKYEMLLLNTIDATNRIIFSDESKYWVEIPNNIIFLKNGNQFITTSERDGYNHLYLVSFQDYKTKKPIISNISQITKGNWVVDKICGIDEKNRVIYYTSTESSAINRDLYSIKFDGSNKTKLSDKIGNNDAIFNSDFKYYINTFSDANTPPIITVHQNNGKIIRNIINNDRVSKLTKEYGFQSKTFFDFKTSANIKLNGWMIKPEDFDAAKKYPVLMFVYGGPGSQSVENQWGYFDLAWHNMLSQKGYIIVCIDNRGTAARGEEFGKCVYKQLGKYETEDQIEGAKYLAKLPFVDASRIGIWGWSYGGYMSSLCITKGADIFKTAIAVAPVANWRNYDNIYTERFMRTPQENPEGYDVNSPINHLKKLKGNYFIIHGSGDDNVHYQNSMELINVLIKENKQFQQFTYPNREHSIYGGNTRLHLYNMLTKYILEYL